MKKILYSAFAISLLASCTYEKGEVPVVQIVEPPCDSIISYATHVVPIINAQCVSCHAPGGTAELSGDFTSYAELKLRADDGSLKKEVYKDKTMPQGTNSMSTEERHIIKCWVDQGAPNN